MCIYRQKKPFKQVELPELELNMHISHFFFLSALLICIKKKKAGIISTPHSLKSDSKYLSELLY